MMYQQLMEMWTLLLDRYLSTRWWHCNHSLYYFVMQVISYKGHSTQQSVKEHHWKFGHVITCPIKKTVLHFADYKENAACYWIQVISDSYYSTAESIKHYSTLSLVPRWPGNESILFQERKGQPQTTDQLLHPVTWAHRAGVHSTDTCAVNYMSYGYPLQ